MDGYHPTTPDCGSPPLARRKTKSVKKVRPRRGQCLECWAYGHVGVHDSLCAECRKDAKESS